MTATPDAITEGAKAQETLRAIERRMIPKHRRFYRAYLTHDCNATKAAIAAGYVETSARRYGSELLTNPDIQAAIDLALQAEGFKAAFCIRRTHAYASARLAQFEPWLLGAKTLDELEADGVDTSLVKSATISETKYGETRRIELYDGQRATETLAKMHGLFKEGGSASTSLGDAPEQRQQSELVQRVIIEQYRASEGQPIDRGIPGVPAIIMQRITGDNGGNGNGGHE